MDSSHLAIDKLNFFRSQGNPSGFLEIEQEIEQDCSTPFILITFSSVNYLNLILILSAPRSWKDGSLKSSYDL